MNICGTENFDLPGWDREKGQNRILLHFGAVDQSCEVRINGHKVKRHTGGYLPFEVDISRYAQESANELIVAVKDLSDTSYHRRENRNLMQAACFIPPRAASGRQYGWKKCRKPT